ncbi:MAG: hypothetical protein K9M07_03165 [Simkaniaceae bacterium]|nr:hypothetical protein [Simkaniaceae bacterium]
MAKISSSHTLSITMLTTYRKKRNLKKTPEPAGSAKKKQKSKKAIFVIQKHHASHLHYDFRLEVNGVLKSWAVPKIPPRSTKIKRLAILTEDHPLSYAKFEGIIPEGQYGAGKVEIWDKGQYENLKNQTMRGSFRKGHIEIFLHGEKLHGPYALIHFKEKNWLLIKMKKKKDKSND